MLRTVAFARPLVDNFCADCNGPIGEDSGPPDGWQLEDGRTVCDFCCAADLRKLVEVLANQPSALIHQTHCNATDLE